MGLCWCCIRPTNNSWATLKQPLLITFIAYHCLELPCLLTHLLLFFHSTGKLHSLRHLCVVHSCILSVLSRTWQILDNQQIFVEWGNELDKGDGQSLSKILRCESAYVPGRIYVSMAAAKRGNQEMGINTESRNTLLLLLIIIHVIKKYHVTVSAKYLGVNLVF